MSEQATETIGYLGAQRLWTVVHQPAGPIQGWAVLVPPFAEEKKAAQRALVELARDLASAGWAVTRFDFTGTGDSAGGHGDATLETWLQDLRAVVAQVPPEVPLTLIGLRLGATLAWRLAVEEPRVRQLVLWEPATSGVAYLRQSRQRSQVRAELTAGAAEVAGSAVGTFDFDGFLLHPELQSAVSELDLAAGRLPSCERVQIVQVSGSSRPKKPYEELCDRCREGGAEAELTVVNVEAFWSAVGLVDTTPVRQATLSWLGLTPTPATPALAPGEVAVVAPEVEAVPVVVPAAGEPLVGVTYRPLGPARRSVVLLHGWSGYRAGPGHLLTEAAREFARAGCEVVSFDFRGRGDSGGEVGAASLNTMIADALAVVATLPERPVTLVGLCSGAEVAIGASLGDPRIDSLVLWSAPIFSGNFDFARRARRSRATLAGYARKLLLPETWAKLFSGRLNWKLIWRAATGGRSSEDAAVVDKAPDTETQMQAFEAFGGSLLFVYGANDPETEPSRAFYQGFVERAGLPHEFGEIAGANHNFYSMRWKQEVVETTLEWVNRLPE